MNYEVITVADHELPEGVDQVIVERPDAPPLMILSGQPARCWRFLRAWEDTQEPCTVPTVAIPAAATPTTPTPPAPRLGSSPLLRAG